MRENGQLRWLLGDHLGSTAYTINGTTESGEVRYRAFGATRFTSGVSPTTYRRVPPGRGQREEAGLGLYYYGARWYAHVVGAKRHLALGHFLLPGTALAFFRLLCYLVYRYDFAKHTSTPPTEESEQL